MKTELAENIRQLRKERSLTQEQLAEALDVTVGAVYKWESGRSSPEIGLLVELAEFFGVSVDSLLGYDMKSSRLSAVFERLGEFWKKRDIESALAEAEAALKRYPNSFRLVYGAAFLNYVSLKKENSRRALALFERAIELIDQNTEEEINEAYICGRMAEIHISMGEYEKAIELLKKHNLRGHNEGMIGMVLAQGCHKPDEALPHLTNALSDIIVDLIHICSGYTNAYIQKKEYDDAIDILQWTGNVIDSTRKPGRVISLDKVRAVQMAACASVAVMKGDETAARDYLRQAKKIAAIFDADPVYDMRNYKHYYMDKTEMSFDSLGETAADAIANTLKTNEDEKIDRRMAELWSEIKNEED